MAGGRTCAVGLPQPNGPVQRDEQDEQSARKEAPVPVKGAQPAAPAQETGCFRYPLFQDPLDLDVMEDPVGDDRIEAIALERQPVGRSDDVPKAGALLPGRQGHFEDEIHRDDGPPLVH
jgi:hypothetical protein